jgi:hypothetical protein
MNGTGFTANTTLPGLIGYEWDATEPGCNAPALTVLFHYQGTTTPPKRPPFQRTFFSTNADVVRYTAPSGARVFSAASIQFTWGLDDITSPSCCSGGGVSRALEPCTARAGPPRVSSTTTECCSDRAENGVVERKRAGQDPNRVRFWRLV